MLRRTESRGSHVGLDDPEMDEETRNAWIKTRQAVDRSLPSQKEAAESSPA